MKITTKHLNKSLWEDLRAYFEFQGKCSGCWCMNHRLPMGLDFEGEAAKLAFKELVVTERVFGVLAYVENEKIPVGWTSVDRKKTLPGHDCVGDKIDIDKNIWSIHCVTSRSDFKNQGVEKIMIEEAVKLVQEMNGICLEGYPEPNSKEGQSFDTWNSFNGYKDIFDDLDFKKIDFDFGSNAEFYCPMKKDLRN